MQNIAQYTGMYMLNTRKHTMYRQVHYTAVVELHGLSLSFFLQRSSNCILVKAELVFRLHFQSTYIQLVFCAFFVTYTYRIHT